MRNGPIKLRVVERTRTEAGEDVVRFVFESFPEEFRGEGILTQMRIHGSPRYVSSWSLPAWSGDTLYCPGKIRESDNESVEMPVEKFDEIRVMVSIFNFRWVAHKLSGRTFSEFLF